MKFLKYILPRLWKAVPEMGKVCSVSGWRSVSGIVEVLGNDRRPSPLHGVNGNSPVVGGAPGMDFSPSQSPPGSRDPFQSL